MWWLVGAALVFGAQIATNKSLPALLALERLHVGVGEAVLLLIVLVLEDPVAEVAGEDGAGGVVRRLDVGVEAAVPLEGLVAELALEHVLGLVAPHVDLEVALVAVGARAHVTHVQVLLLHAMECKLLDRFAYVKLMPKNHNPGSTLY